MKSTAKTPYASQLFGNDPHETLTKGAAQRKAGFRAVKFGWGPYGQGDAATDAAHIPAARRARFAAFRGPFARRAFHRVFRRSKSRRELARSDKYPILGNWAFPSNAPTAEVHSAE